MNTFDFLKYRYAEYCKRHPKLWSFSIDLALKFKCLLPHEKDYYGIEKLNLDNTKTLLDIGTNNGVSALGFRKLGFSGEILSIEGNKLFEKKLQNVKSSDDKFDFIIACAGNKQESSILYVPYVNGTCIHALSSLIEQHAKNNILRVFKENVSYEIKTIKSNIIVLDDYDIDTCFIKIDAEGFAVQVLQGLQKTIQKYNPIILLEFDDNSDQEATRYLLKTHTINIFDIKHGQFHKVEDIQELAKYQNKYLFNNVYMFPKVERATITPK